MSCIPCVDKLRLSLTLLLLLLMFSFELCWQNQITKSQETALTFPLACLTNGLDWRVWHERACHGLNTLRSGAKTSVMGQVGSAHGLGRRAIELCKCRSFVLMFRERFQPRNDTREGQLWIYYSANSNAQKLSHSRSCLRRSESAD